MSDDFALKLDSVELWPSSNSAAFESAFSKFFEAENQNSPPLRTRRQNALSTTTYDYRNPEALAQHIYKS